MLLGFSSKYLQYSKYVVSWCKRFTHFFMSRDGDEWKAKNPSVKHTSSKGTFEPSHGIKRILSQWLQKTQVDTVAVATINQNMKKIDAHLMLCACRENKLQPQTYSSKQEIQLLWQA